MIISRVEKHRKTSFAAGKTHVFSDFRGTYMPFQYNEIIDLANTQKTSHFNTMYSKFRLFCEKAKDKIDFAVTTGQSKLAIDNFLKIISKKNLNFFLPNKLITNNGGDTFERVSPSEFKVSQGKIKEVEKDSGWKKSEVTDDLKNILKQKNPQISFLDFEEVGSTGTFLKERKDNNYALLKNNSEFRINLSLPRNVDADDLIKTFKSHFKEKKINLEIEKRLDEEFKLPVYSENGTSELKSSQGILLKPKIDASTPLTKLYDPRKQLRKNVETKNDDLVVVAGDGFFDSISLNPFNYLDKPIKMMFEDDYKNALEDKDILKQFREMPLVSVVVGNDPDLDQVREIGKMLDEKGIHIVRQINNPQEELLDSIKKGMSDYAQMNKNYRDNLGEDLSQEISGEDKSNKNEIISGLIPDFSQRVLVHK